MPSTTRVQMKRRPDGFARPDDFEVVTLPRPEPREGEVLVQNIWMSVDPYMRRSMDEDGKDLAPWPIGGALDGPSIGRVIASRHPGFGEGDLVESMSGWQEHFISSGTDFIPYLTPNDARAVRSAPGARPRDWLGLLGPGRRWLLPRRFGWGWRASRVPPARAGCLVLDRLERPESASM